MEDRRNIQEKKVAIVPVCRIVEEDGGIVISVELPGIPRESIDVRIDRDELLITGKAPEQQENGEYMLRERRTGDYRKAFTIDDTIDRERIDAVYANGVMNIALHLREAVKPRRIEIAPGR